jgi:putative FmdB family regulatory protein
MPAYDFKCTECGDVFEITRPAGQTVAVSCPVCESPAKKVFSPVGVHFKGSGFYNTDRQTGPTPATVAPPAAAAASTGDAAPAPACPAATGGTCASCPAAAAD